MCPTSMKTEREIVLAAARGRVAVTRKGLQACQGDGVSV